MLVDLGQDVYHEEYERHLLAEAANWYRLEAAEFVASCACPDYLRKVQAVVWMRSPRPENRLLMPCSLIDGTRFTDMGNALYRSGLHIVLLTTGLRLGAAFMGCQAGLLCFD